jgi:hypothetical protein
MSGCDRAIAERDRLQRRCAPLAYRLDEAPGWRCRRAGGASICGICAGDLRPEDRQRDQDAAKTPQDRR